MECPHNTTEWKGIRLTCTECGETVAVLTDREDPKEGEKPACEYCNDTKTVWSEVAGMPATCGECWTDPD